VVDKIAYVLANPIAAGAVRMSRRACPDRALRHGPLSGARTRPAHYACRRPLHREPLESRSGNSVKQWPKSGAMKHSSFLLILTLQLSFTGCSDPGERATGPGHIDPSSDAGVPPAHSMDGDGSPGIP